MYQQLLDAAKAARGRAYAPYTEFLVGAALLSTTGRVFAGCNIENVSIGLTICAERVCIGTALEQGERNFEAIAIVADSSVPIVPCGACRQVLAEFSPALRIISSTLHGQRDEFELGTLLPKPRQGILE